MAYLISYILFNLLLVFAHYADADKMTLKQFFALLFFGIPMLIIGAIQKLRHKRD